MYTSTINYQKTHTNTDTKKQCLKCSKITNAPHEEVDEQSVPITYTFLKNINHIKKLVIHTSPQLPFAKKKKKK